MNPRDQEPLNIPSMAAERDDSRRRPSPKRKTSDDEKSGSGGVGLTTLIAMILAITATGAAFVLWQQGQGLTNALGNAEQRIADLESRLNSTGDEISQSGEAMAVRLKELNSEVAKLWDARKASNQKIATHETNIRNLTTRTEKQQASQTSLSGQLTAVSASLDEVVEDLADVDLDNLDQSIDNVQKNAKQLQQELKAITGRVADNEEWLESVNAFRRQVNDRLNALQNPTTSTPVLQ